MKTKTILWVALAAGLLAGCASEKSEQTKQARLEAGAKIARADAERTALAQVPNGTVKEAEIEKEHGRLIWSFDITVPDSKDIKEVAVDAMTGQMVSVETETAEQETREKD
ncbi:MAG TPA: PepSY domain-containing protein [Verrucomicrobiae bacterium]|nr:PepSY domain-containing protein [Verrucomicrobiae bacterium]